jgi:hypothetical protein
VEAWEKDWKSEKYLEGLRYSVGQRYAYQHSTLQGALKVVVSKFTPETGSAATRTEQCSYGRKKFTPDTFMVSVAIGVFEERRKLRAWEREAIEAEPIEADDAPATRQPSSKRRPRITAKPAKLAAARMRSPTKRSRAARGAGDGGAE